MESLIGRSFDAEAVKEQHKKRRVFLVSALACILACAAIFYLGFRWFLNKQYDAYEKKGAVRVKGTSLMNYVAYDGGVLRFGRDGVTAVNRKGKSVWNGGYDMANPQVDVCGSSAVVADIGEKSLYVYGGDGTGTEFAVDYPIVQACVSRQGVVAVLMEESASNLIALYNPFDKTQKLLVEIPTNVEDGYPVCMDLSPDGTSLVASYLCVTTGTPQSRVAFYNFSDVGKNANCLVGAHNYNKTLISEVRFMDAENVCLFGEKGIYVWNNMKKPEAACKKEFSENIRSAFCDESHFGVMLGREKDSGRLQVYGADGGKELDISVKGTYNQIEIAGDEILLYSATECCVYRLNGVRKFYQELHGKISYFFPSDKRNWYYFVQNSKIVIIKLK